MCGYLKFNNPAQVVKDEKQCIGQFWPLLKRAKFYVTINVGIRSYYVELASPTLSFALLRYLVPHEDCMHLHEHE